MEAVPVTKAVIMVGGPSVGTRFRPLSLRYPKPLFPIAGKPMIQHHIEACANVPGMKEIFLLGFYEENEFENFITDAEKEYNIPIRYLQEGTELGTAGGLNKFKDLIAADSAEEFFVLHCDVCCPFPLREMLEFHRERVNEAKEKSDVEIFGTLLGTTVSSEYSHFYGCLVADDNQRIVHYVEKPKSDVSNLINSGIYCFNAKILTIINQIVAQIKKDHASDIPLRESISSLLRRSSDHVRLEQDILIPLASDKHLVVFKNSGFWKQIKNAGSPVYTNDFYLREYAKKQSPLLTTGPNIQGNVVIHPSAKVHPSAVIGPNVSIGENVTVGRGVRITHSIVLGGAHIMAQACVMYSIIGWGCTVERWCRIEGIPNPTPSLYTEKDGRQGICVLGEGLLVYPELIIRNCIICPNKTLHGSYFNEILL